MPKNVLIVEGDAALSARLRAGLEASGDQVHETADGQGSLELIRRLRPHWIVLAVDLPAGQNGYLICAKLKKDADLREIPVVILGEPSGFAQHQKLKTRADAYVSKPVDLSDFLGKASELEGVRRRPIAGEQTIGPAGAPPMHSTEADPTSTGRRQARLLRFSLGILLGVVALLIVAALNLGSLVKFAMSPSGGFDAQSAPPAPDYSDPASWSALPDREDFGDASPVGFPPVDQREAPADVFYVHPTSYLGSNWNAPIDDPSLNDGTDRLSTGIQATAFNGCCAVYAPRYRQANGMAFLRQSEDGRRAIDLAYSDVKRAFDAFNARRGAGRPFILASHSQGTVVAERLLQEAISGTPLREQLVAAYLMGGAGTVEGVREKAPDVPPCAAATELHCVAGWNARGAGFLSSEFEMHRTDLRERLCTNPLTWRVDGAAASAELNEGAVFLESDDRSPRPGFASAQCVDGTLLLEHVGVAPRDFMSRMLDHTLGAGNYHAIEYQLFFMNLRENAIARVAAFNAAAKE